MSVATVLFPSKEAIVSYLQQHPLTKDPYLTEKKIIETMANFFAKQEKVPDGINLGVMLSLSDVNKKLKLPRVALMTIQINLVAALKDCANGKKIEVEKK